MSEKKATYWELPDADKIKFVKDNYAELLNGSEDGRYLIEMFNTFTKTRDAALKQKLQKMANEHYGYQPETQSPVRTSTTPADDEQPVRMLSEAIESHLQEIEGKKAHTTILAKKSKLPFILGALGDKPINQYQREDFLAVEQKLKKFPKTGRSNPKYKGMSIDDIIRLNTGEPPWSDTTVHGYLIAMNTLFNECVKWGWLERSLCPTWEKSLEMRKSKGWQPWDIEEINKLLQTSYLSKKDRRKKPHNFWVPLIALFGGLRLDEICQLYLDDIKVAESEPESGIFCFHINEDADKKVKNHTPRLVPIHSALIKLGFLDYVEDMRKARHERVFPQLNRGDHGYSTGFSKNVGKLIRRHVTKDREKVFHSLRKNASRVMLSQGVDIELISEILGHSGVERKVTRLYTGKYPVKMKQEAIEKIDHGIDIVGIVESRM